MFYSKGKHVRGVYVLVYSIQQIVIVKLSKKLSFILVQSKLLVMHQLAVTLIQFNFRQDFHTFLNFNNGY